MGIVAERPQTSHTARRYIAVIQDAGGYAAPLAALDPAPPEGPPAPVLHSVVRVDDLLTPEFVERLWSHLPLNVSCTCEERWNEDLEVWEVDEDACECARLSIPAVRNCLAAALGEPQIAADQFGQQREGSRG